MIFYGRVRIPRISGNLVHAQTVCTRLSFQESLGSRLGHNMLRYYGGGPETEV